MALIHRHRSLPRSFMVIAVTVSAMLLYTLVECLSSTASADVNDLCHADTEGAVANGGGCCSGNLRSKMFAGDMPLLTDTADTVVTADIRTVSAGFGAVGSDDKILSLNDVDGNSTNIIEMVLIPSQHYVMGTDFIRYIEDGEDSRTVAVDSFQIDSTETSNDEFAQFVAATGS